MEPAAHESLQYSFSLEILDKRLPETDIRRIVREVTDEALQEVGVESGAATTDVEGGFGGIGEVVILLLIKKAAALLASSILVGAGKKAGEVLFEEHIAPKLRARNLIPKNLRKVDPPPNSQHNA
jgi:hypothetical protein